jgi:glycosyltransferase involved in cell wall biosynthesis
MRVLVLAEYYPRAGDQALGIWAHRQTLAVRRAGVDLQVLVLHRPVPPLSAIRTGDLATARTVVRQPRRAQRDGIPVDYLRYFSPPRPLSYPTWGAWAAPWLRRAMRRIRRDFPFDLVHAHYAVPAGDAVRRADPRVPVVVSVHGGDVLGDHADAPQVAAALGHARLVLANSAGTARRCDARGARRTRVVHLGADIPAQPRPAPATPTIVTVGNLIARKRHTDVIDAVARLRDRVPELVYLIVGDGPERGALERRAAQADLAGRVRFLGRLAPDAALDAAGDATLMVMPSTEEAFGVAYVEAMAAGVPAIGSRGEDGPMEIAAAGPGIELVSARDPAALAEMIGAMIDDPERLRRLRRSARETVQRAFAWDRCGAETVDAYAEALRA